MAVPDAEGEAFRPLAASAKATAASNTLNKLAKFIGNARFKTCSA